VCNLLNVACDPQALRVVKRAVPVAVAFATRDGVCETLEGSVRCRAGDAILVGACGERWPVRRELFVSTYSPIPQTNMGNDGVYFKRPSVTFALRIKKRIAVPAGWQSDLLDCNPGNWLLRYPDGTYGVLQDAIFRETYSPAYGEARWPPPQ
jgi:PGDYG protein